MGKFYDDYESDAIEIWDALLELQKRCAKLESES